MAELEVFEQRVERAAVQRAPGAVQVVARLRLLARVVVVQELVDDLLPLALPFARFTFRLLSCIHPVTFIDLWF